MNNFVIQTFFTTLKQELAVLSDNIQMHHAASLHEIRDSIKGKDVVLVASGPSINLFSNIENAVYVGINHTAFLENINFSFLFLQDNVKIVIEQCKKIEKKCSIICGVHVSYPNRMIDVPTLFNNYYVYYVYSLFSANPQKMQTNLLTNELSDFTSTVFCAMQIIAWCQPKKIYLVGCDCTSRGNFLSSDFTTPYSNIVPCWRLLKRFMQDNYPDIKIISINPVGLRGVFEDRHQHVDIVQLMSLFNSGQKRQALDLLDQALQAAPDNRGLLSLRQQLLRTVGDGQGAWRAAREWTCLFPTQAEAWLEYSLLAEGAGKEQEAVDWTCRALELAPDSFAPHAQACQQLHRHEAVTPWIRLADMTATMPGKMAYWPSAWSCVANSYRKKGEYTQASTCYAKALALCPDDFFLRTEFISFARQSGNIAQARKLLQEGFALRADWAEGWYQKALIEEKLRHGTKAVHALYKAMEMAPLAMHYQARLVSVLRQFRCLAEAEAVLDEALTLCPDWPDGHYQRSLNQVAAGLMSQATESARKAVGLLPPELHFARPYMTHLVSLLLSTNRGREAEKQLRHVLKTVPEWGEGWKLLSELYENCPIG